MSESTKILSLLSNNYIKISEYQPRGEFVEVLICDKDRILIACAVVSKEELLEAINKIK